MDPKTQSFSRRKIYENIQFILKLPALFPPNNIDVTEGICYGLSCMFIQASLFPWDDKDALPPELKRFYERLHHLSSSRYKLEDQYFNEMGACLLKVKETSLEQKQGMKRRDSEMLIFIDNMLLYQSEFDLSTNMRQNAVQISQYLLPTALQRPGKEEFFGFISLYNQVILTTQPDLSTFLQCLHRAIQKMTLDPSKSMLPQKLKYGLLISIPSHALAISVCHYNDNGEPYFYFFDQNALVSSSSHQFASPFTLYNYETISHRIFEAIHEYEPSTFTIATRRYLSFQILTSPKEIHKYWVKNQEFWLPSVLSKKSWAQNLRKILFNAYHLNQHSNFTDTPSKLYTFFLDLQKEVNELENKETQESPLLVSTAFIETRDNILNFIHLLFEKNFNAGYHHNFAELPRQQIQDLDLHLNILFSEKDDMIEKYSSLVFFDSQIEDSAKITSMEIAQSTHSLTTLWRFLSDKHIDINKHYEKASPLLIHSIFYNYFHLAKSLIQDPRINLNLLHKNFTPLHCAAFKNNHAILKLLMEKGAMINKINQDGNTALHLAALRGYVKIINTLLQYPLLDINRINKNKKTALDLARNCGHIEAIKVLLSHPQTINSSNC